MNKLRALVKFALSQMGKEGCERALVDIQINGHNIILDGRVIGRNGHY